MERLTTFEDIYNKLNDDFNKVRVEINTKQAGVNISNYYTTINKILVKPLNKKESKNWNKEGKKVGLIILKGKRKKTTLNIPFILDFNTMDAIFLKKGVTIKSLGLEFIIKKIANKKSA